VHSLARSGAKRGIHPQSFAKVVENYMLVVIPYDSVKLRLPGFKSCTEVHRKNSFHHFSIGGPHTRQRHFIFHLSSFIIDHLRRRLK
jgi:hypothetical protein